MIETRSRLTRLPVMLALLFWITLAFAILPSGLSFSPGSVSSTGQSGSLFRRVQWMTPFLAAGVIAWLRRDLAVAVFRRLDPFLLAFTAWAAATIAWSAYPDVSLRKLVLLVGAILIALVCQLRTFDPGWLRRHLRALFTVMLVISTVVALVLPDIGQVAGYDDAWAGITRSKNHLGLMAGWAAALWLHGLAARAVAPRHGLPALAFALFVLVMAKDATALLCTVLVLPAVWLALRPPMTGRRIGAVFVLAGAALVVTLVFGVLVIHGVPGWREVVAPIAHAVGRNVTFTGRLEIWRLVYAEAIQHPLLGSGFQAFWLGAGGPAPWVTQNLYGVLWQGHNGYLDVFNETGLVGLVITIAFLANTARRALVLPPALRDEAVLAIAFVAFFAASNLTESIVFRPIHFLFFLMLHVSLSISRMRLAVDRAVAEHRIAPSPEAA